MEMKRILLLLFAFCLNVAAATNAPFALNDLLAIKRVGDPQISPDGQWVAYSVREPNLEANKFSSHIWIQRADGSGEPRQLTNHEKGESRPQWSPNSKTISFLSTRSGSQQVWLIPVDGGEARQLTTISTDADNHIWSPDGSLIAFTSDVWPDLKDDAAQKKRTEEREAGPKAQIIDSLLYRHWTDWRHGKRSHIFVVPVAGGAPRDITPGDFEAPVFSLARRTSSPFRPTRSFSPTPAAPRARTKHGRPTPR